MNFTDSYLLNFRQALTQEPFDWSTSSTLDLTLVLSLRHSDAAPIELFAAFLNISKSSGLHIDNRVAALVRFFEEAREFLTEAHVEVVGPFGIRAVALDRATGAVRWRSLRLSPLAAAC